MSQNIVGVVGEGLFEIGMDPASHFAGAFGGDAANIAVMAARCGVGSRLAGRVGADSLGAWLRDRWTHCGVDLDHLVVDSDAPTGIYTNSTDTHGAHVMDYHRSGSAGSRWTGSDLRDDFFDSLGAFVFTGITLSISASSAGAAMDGVRRARSLGVEIAFVVNHRAKLHPDAASLATAAEASDIVFCSEDEAVAVFGTADAIAITRRLQPSVRLILTRGGLGVTLVHGEVVSDLPAPAVHLVDAAGAGDALAGTYLARRCMGDADHDALRLAAAVASDSVTRHGCANSYPSRAEVERLLRQR